MFALKTLKTIADLNKLVNNISHDLPGFAITTQILQ
jgi:hypothetical protein